MRYSDFEIQFRKGDVLVVSAEWRAMRAAEHLEIKDLLVSPVGLPGLELGQRLFERIFVGAIRQLFYQSVGLVEASGEVLRLKLVFDERDHDPELELLHSIPWELLTPPGERPLSLDQRFSIVRYLPLALEVSRRPQKGKLKVLWVSAAPQIERAPDNPRIEVEFLSHATPELLLATLEKQEFHILHFVGQGAFDPESGDGVLFLKGEEDKARFFGGRWLAEAVSRQNSLRLVFLSACETACAGTPNPLGGLAVALARTGIPTVIGMQFPITNSSVMIFSEYVYRGIAAGNSIDLAVAAGRYAIEVRRRGSYEWGSPVVFIAGDMNEPISTENAALKPEGRPLGRLADTSDPTPLHLDSPAIADRLGRRGFARALAIRLERIWREMNPENRPADRPVPQGSFVLHLHGPWGSGKSSILEMLRRELRPEGKPAAPTVGSPWVVVDFNAWQNQRLDPPWWPLLDGIFRQSARQVPWVRRTVLKMREGLWRFTIRRRDLLIFTFVALGCGLLGYLFLPPSIVLLPQKPDAGDVAEKVTNILGLLALVGGWLWLGSRSLISGSARAAQSFLDSAADPMDRIQRHFQKMVRTVDRPIAVFVDDLDRCQASYVVQLLEGIQTLFRDPRVIYVIAADQRWLHACFEKTYEAFAESVHEPGRRLGSLFLEKAFEISVALPELSPGVRAGYWRFLLGGDPAQAEQRLASLEQEARAEFRHDRSEQQVVARLDENQGETEAADPLRAQARRQVAVEQLASAAVEKSVSYFLQPFAPLLEPNPRSMKRLLNAYAIRRDLAILSGLDVLGDEKRRKKLALWTILALRWPALEDFLRDKAGGDDSEPSAEVAALLASSELKEVVMAPDLGGPLTLDDLKALLGFGPVGDEKV